ncbi:MAG TPA: adenosine deaminase, partial [Alphaproteobacteria bacterium]|nr:adenosine deaminase [Alphaproteobacteria bacterium]
MTIERFIAGLPKAELHLHIEGTLEPEMALALGRRNGVVLPWANTSELRAAYDFANLQEFLDLYYQGIRVLIEERDFHELTMAYLRQVGAQNVRHAEVFFDAQ